MKNWIKTHIPGTITIVMMIGMCISLFVYHSINGFFLFGLFAAILAAIFPNGKN